MTKNQQSKIFKAMNEEQKARVEAFLMMGLNRNTAISSVVMQDMVKSTNPKSMVVYAN